MTKIIALITQITGLNKIPVDGGIVKDLGCDGDDFFKLIEEYSKKFKVK
jgi:hypothetical protein